MKQRLRPNRRHALALLILLLGLYVVLPQLHGFRASWHLLSHPDIAWSLLAVACTALTYLAAAGTYYFLAFSKLVYRRIVLVQLAAMFVNRLVPAGLGALGSNYVFLRRHHHSRIQALTVTAVNNTLGFIGHSLLLAVSLTIALGWTQQTLSLHLSKERFLSWLIIGAAVLLVALVMLRGRQLHQSLQSVLRQLRLYKKKPRHLVAALITSMALTSCNIGCFACCCLALNVHVSLLAGVIVFTLGVGGGIAVPTPGGLGGFEAALTAGLVALHVAGAAALAVALLYRLISYWATMLVGAFAFVWAERLGYI